MEVTRRLGKVAMGAARNVGEVQEEEMKVGVKGTGGYGGGDERGTVNFGRLSGAAVGADADIGRHLKSVVRNCAHITQIVQGYSTRNSSAYNSSTSHKILFNLTYTVYSRYMHTPINACHRQVHGKCHDRE